MVLVVSVGVPKSTRSRDLIVCPLAYNHVHGYQLSPSLLIIIDCIDSAGKQIVSSSQKGLCIDEVSLGWVYTSHSATCKNWNYYLSTDCRKGGQILRKQENCRCTES
jgi:hypothetical protein